MIGSMFTTQLVNDPFGDPGVYLEFKYRQDALLFDLGDLRALSPRQILKVRYIFVSHTHMDHFIGFDHLLRISLGRDSHISLFGPPGFHRNVESKIHGYTWNLVENYENDFQLSVTEVHPAQMTTRVYACRTAFRPQADDTSQAFDGTLVDDRLFRVRAGFLDHKIPCLAFRFEEKTRINIMKNAVTEMGLQTGPWITAFKDSVLKSEDDEFQVNVSWKDADGNIVQKKLPLGLLKQKIVKFSQGKAVAYITDAVYNEENRRKIFSLAENVECLFIEAPFLHEDAEKAALKFHLTAFQAGTIGREAKAKRIVLFHFSPKYQGSMDLLCQEAMRAFMGDATTHLT